MCCSELKDAQSVVFQITPESHSEKVYLFGSVFSVNNEKRTVCVRYLDGPKSKYKHIPFEDMIAVYDKNAPLRKIGPISGNCILLEKGE